MCRRGCSPNRWRRKTGRWPGSPCSRRSSACSFRDGFFSGRWPVIAAPAVRAYPRELPLPPGEGWGEGVLMWRFPLTLPLSQRERGSFSGRWPVIAARAVETATLVPRSLRGGVRVVSRRAKLQCDDVDRITQMADCSVADRLPLAGFGDRRVFSNSLALVGPIVRGRGITLRGALDLRRRRRGAAGQLGGVSVLPADRSVAGDHHLHHLLVRHLLRPGHSPDVAQLVQSRRYRLGLPVIPGACRYFRAAE